MVFLVIYLSHKSVDWGVFRDHSSVTRLREPGGRVIDIQETDPDHDGGGFLVTAAPGKVGGHHPQAVALRPLSVEVRPAQRPLLHLDCARVSVNHELIASLPMETIGHLKYSLISINLHIFLGPKEYKLSKLLFSCSIKLISTAS